MRANDVRSTDIIGYGAYVCLTVTPDASPLMAAAAVPALAGRLGLRNEFAPGDGPAERTVAFLRCVTATSGAIADDGLLDASAVVHVASASAEPVVEFCGAVRRLVGSAARVSVLDGVVRPLNYTGNAMHNFAYAHRILQQAGTVMPNAFLVPMSKTPAWWAKDWMERHTYFLPRYDDSGRMLNEGHALAAAAGISCVMRRTYKYPVEPAPPGAYDFINYFECSDATVPTFDEVCAALRDVARNPEWQFVREGPTWRGRRVATWAELFA